MSKRAIIDAKIDNGKFRAPALLEIVRSLQRIIDEPAAVIDICHLGALMVPALRGSRLEAPSKLGISLGISLGTRLGTTLQPCQ